jgi:uncharacterized damage-inducible protein DinB
MTLNDIHVLYEFNYWAKARMLGALDSLPEQELYKDLKTSFGGIHGTLVHICGAEDIWLQRFNVIPNPKFLKNADLPDYSAVKKRWDEVEKGMRTYVLALTEQQLQGKFSYTNIKGEPFSNVRWQALQHLVNHGTYHRGQITSMIRQLGGTPVSTDMIAFYRQRAQQKS